MVVPLSVEVSLFLEVFLSPEVSLSLEVSPSLVLFPVCAVHQLPLPVESVEVHRNRQLSLELLYGFLPEERHLARIARIEHCLESTVKFTTKKFNKNNYFCILRERSAM